MKAGKHPKTPRLPVFDMIIKSVSDIKRNYSLIIRELEERNEPAFVMNHNTPEAVLMSYAYYKNTIVETQSQIDRLLGEINQLENEMLEKLALERLADKNKKWLVMDDVFDAEADSTNPYDAMTNEELFD